MASLPNATTSRSVWENTSQAAVSDSFLKVRTGAAPLAGSHTRTSKEMAGDIGFDVSFYLFLLSLYHFFTIYTFIHRKWDGLVYVLLPR